MNTRECDILLSLCQGHYRNQRELAEHCGCALGTVNSALKTLTSKGWIDQEWMLTDAAHAALHDCRPRNAIILAAGYGMRMVPINREMPKAMLEVRGETLIERQIRHLHEAGIREIYVVVGYMKERFEYLIDKYGVSLVFNPFYASKNNLYSLALVADHISNTYIIPGDIWCASNPFSRNELYSWYMVSERRKKNSYVRVGRNMDLIEQAHDGNEMLGISYLLHAQAKMVRERIAQLCADEKNSSLFWEEALYEKNRMCVKARVAGADDAVEINTYEQLREIDRDSGSLKTDAIEVIAQALNVRSDEIADIRVLKKGMTNRSFLFSCRGRKYIMRIPGEGTDRLINRRAEARVYRAIENRDICDKVIYINPQNGYKITEYIENARVCDPLDEADLQRCMKRLRDFHQMALSVEHEFDLFAEIERYERFRGGGLSVYIDYPQTKESVLRLRPYIQAHAGRKVLTHVDAVPDNFLFARNPQGEEEICLIDWEYAGMQDPHVDIAMFSIYALYDRKQIDHLIDIYFENGCTRENRIKVYSYVSVCGLLWSNWCEYKRSLGVEFGEYSLAQYRYAKEYVRIAQEEIRRMEEM